ncbi:MAG TPA: hypothetical protein VFS34_04705, partial [Thermoanaerobaculia bacterium]|nr:hypothetical protein [Thermoanaerobaculia bacterium]
STGDTGPTVTVSPDATTTYTAVGYAPDCTGPAATFTVAVSPALQSASASVAGATTLCPSATGGTASVTDFGGSGVSHQWGYRTEPGGSIHPIAGATGVAYTISGSDLPLAAGGPFYLVCVSTSACGESVVTNDVSGRLESGPDATISAPSVLCGSSAAGTASVPEAGAGATYAWSLTTGSILSGAGTRSITFTPNSASGTVVSVTVTSADGCQASGSASVAVDNSANAAVSAPAAVCAGSGGYAASAVSNSGNSYAWTISGGAITAGAGTPSVVFTAGTGASVVLGLSVRTPNGCMATSSTTIPINPLPLSSITTPSNVCAGSSSTASTVSQAGAGYSWTISGGTITAGAGTNTITYTAGASGSALLGVTVQTAAGCSSSSSATVSINAAPSAAITAPSSIKAKQKGSASVPSAGSGATYVWSVTNGTINSGNGTPSISLTAGSRGTMTLSVTVRNASGCSASGSKAVTVN